MEPVRIVPRPWPRGTSSAAVVADAITELGLHPEDCFGVLPCERNGRVLLLAYRDATKGSDPFVAFREVPWREDVSVAHALADLSPADVYGFFPGRWDSHQWRSLLVAHRPTGTRRAAVRIVAHAWPRGRRLRAPREDVEAHARAVLAGVPPETCFGLGTDRRSDHLLLARAA